VERDAADQREINYIRARSPRAVEVLEQGETLAAAGRLEEAVSLFREGAALDPLGSLLWRRECEASTALGRRKDATAACRRALATSSSNTNAKALVRAMMGGPSAPTASDLLAARMFATLDTQRNVRGPLIVTATACEIAESLGDGAMLQDCVNRLLEIAPAAPETRKALALLRSRCPPARFWAGWLGIGALCLITAIHAIRRFARRAQGEAAEPAAPR
jgi:tetratricopeptide (TPR) repeat protein